MGGKLVHTSPTSVCFFFVWYVTKVRVLFEVGMGESNNNVWLGCYSFNCKIWKNSKWENKQNREKCNKKIEKTNYNG